MPDTAPTWSLRRRLRGWLLVLMLGGWLCGAGAALLGLWHETDEVLDSALLHTALRLLALPDAAFGREGEAVSSSGPEGDFVTYQVFDRQGRLRLHSHDAPVQPLDPGAPDGLREAGAWRVLTRTRADGERRAQVAETVAHRGEVLWDSLGWLLAALLAMVPLAALGLRSVLARAFAALEPIRQDLARLDAEHLQPISARGIPEELAPWLASTNALIARVQVLVESERAFAAHTAHELRTPLAAARAQAQRLALLSDADPAVRQHAEALVRQLDRLTRLATRLLQLARIDAGVALRREPVDLGALAGLVADEFAGLQRQGRLHVQAGGTAVIVHGDIDALGIALRNLVDNALKHGGAAAQVVIAVQPRSVSVADDGPGVAAPLLPSLVRQFQRGPGCAVEGSGLGLAMVDTIARQSGATLRLESPLDGGRPGFRATLDFGA